MKTMRPKIYRTEEERKAAARAASLRSSKRWINNQKRSPETLAAFRKASCRSSKAWKDRRSPARKKRDNAFKRLYRQQKKQAAQTAQAEHAHPQVQAPVAPLAEQEAVAPTTTEQKAPTAQQTAQFRQLLQAQCDYAEIYRTILSPDNNPMLRSLPLDSEYELSSSSSDDDDHYLYDFLYNDDDDDSLSGGSRRRNKKSDKPNTNKTEQALSDATALVEYHETKFGTTACFLDWYPKKEQRPRLPVGAKLTKHHDPQEKFLARSIPGAIRQILKKRGANGVPEFHYIIKCSVPSLGYPIELVSETNLLEQATSFKRELVKIPDKHISRSNTDTDIFLMLTKEEKLNNQFPPQLCRYVTNPKATLLDFERRLKDANFRQQQNSFLHHCHQAVLQHPVVAPRLLWKSWNSYHPTDSRHKWFYFAIIQFAMSQTDSSLEGPIKQMFQLQLRSPRCCESFDNPVNVARQPKTIIAFFKGRSTNKTKDLLDTITALTPAEGGATKSFNIWLTKARAFILNSKKLCLLYVAQHVLHLEGNPAQLESKIIHHPPYEHFNLESIMLNTSLEPLPDPLLDLIPKGKCMFPELYQEDFFLNLRNVSHKSAYLCAEAMYGKVAGPAFDCHVSRWTISFGVIPALVSRNQPRAIEYIKKVYDNHTAVNETPGAIAQIVGMAKDSGHPQLLLSSLYSIAARFGVGFEVALERFLEQP